MFFAAPISTDAPIYHWPRATLGLIVAQLAVFVMVTSGALGQPDDVLSANSLQYGDGLHPLQWLTSIFLHDGFLHLAGNLFFLWGLGLVVEGKLGWARFLAVYLTIGVIESAIEQAALGGLQGSSCGSSSILFGLLAMALLWAPRNDLTFGYVLLLPMFFRLGSFDLSLQAYGAFALAQEGLLTWWNGFRPATEVLHLAGAAIGAGLGWSLLKAGTVDCEGWDLISLLRGSGFARVPSRTSTRSPLRSRDLLDDAVVDRRHSLRRIRKLLQESRPLLAWQQLRETRHWVPDWQPPLDDLQRMASALLEREQWTPAVDVLLEVISRNPDSEVSWRLMAAAALVENLNRPQAGLKQLQPIDRSTLSAADLQRLRELERRAFEMIDAGVLEFDSRPG